MTLGGRKIVKLPLGYVGNGIFAEEAEIRAMVGFEEDILSDDKLPIIDRLNMILLNCITRLGAETDKAKIKEMIPKLSVEDQTTLLVSLRAISVSPIYTYLMVCPSCDAKIKFDLDLNSLAVIPAKAKDGMVMELVLPSGRKAKIRPLLIEDTAQLDKIRANGEALLSVAIWIRLVELDGKTNPTLDDVKQLLYADRLAIRNAFESMEGGIENSFYIKCNGCGNSFESFLDIARPEFLMPKM